MFDPSDVTPPRQRPDLIGHARAEAEFGAAIRSGRLHHAWLIGGPAGIGKATLAFRVARRLLAAPAELVGDGLAVEPDGRTARQVAARSHPNLVVLERSAGEGEKAPSRIIPTDAVRKALNFFGTTAANGGKRVCIVDSVDDLNLNGANALLKTMEEPPADSVLLIVSHAPARLLPTIRSRCRKLDLSPLATGEVETVLDSLGLDDPGLRQEVAASSDGSVRRALTLLDPKRRALVAEMTAMLDALPDESMLRVLALAERLADRKAEDDFAVALDVVVSWVARRIRQRAGEGARRLAPLAEVCEKLADKAKAVETYNLDRRTFVIELFGDLAEAVRLAA